MRSKIEERTQLTASAGIASNTFLAKVCSDINKPNGQYVLPANHADILEFVNKLPIRKASGIGNVQEQLLKSLGVNTCGDLYLKRGEIKLLFSQLSFENYMQISQGIGGTRLEPREDRLRKSMSNETTFKETSDRNILIGRTLIPII
ncbi:DNA polymerase kappa [Eurytemora carolleeae]|uniref:DNA polymerase kappa n=1 Tax=Eurytemora carolleeae TaxID=1294199 RepID=UPI000C79408F|nr:DNA polymerase kappa [Eurytemora carolleeae]|eukprot:XP_023319907.1 DNA polymerase kappa-like [Eurytemora affinis]